MTDTTDPASAEHAAPLSAEGLSRFDSAGTVGDGPGVDLVASLGGLFGPRTLGLGLLPLLGVASVPLVAAWDDTTAEMVLLAALTVPVLRVGTTTPPARSAAFEASDGPWDDILRLVARALPAVFLLGAVVFVLVGLLAPLGDGAGPQIALAAGVSVVVSVLLGAVVAGLLPIVAAAFGVRAVVLPEAVTAAIMGIVALIVYAGLALVFMRPLLGAGN